MSSEKPLKLVALLRGLSGIDSSVGAGAPEGGDLNQVIGVDPDARFGSADKEREAFLPFINKVDKLLPK